ncbi:MAG: usg protein [Sphingomonadaceae bacterium]|uniref:protein usg n=1 Tax=Thermaurantiacus sp. TaxID=2820283 RepID=UPI00298EE55D|nr:protein usg [Thermaurantiacus sp.]MCS6987343.1 usg protein [Sphingomonadaceae bacterium]MDW8414564.1 protein usg [Thermaurantiacus sp.]
MTLDGTNAHHEELARRLAGEGLLTAEISYWLPDHPSVLQIFVWQTLDRAPTFPALHRFLDHWRREIEATIHQIRIAHSTLLKPTEVRLVDGILHLH